MEATIEVTGLRKRFGSALALDGMTFTVAPGQVTGFVGPNGAGKSTTMRVILGLDAADEGTATIGGRSYASLRHPLSQVGSLLDAGALQPSRSARNHLLWLAHSQGLGARRADEVIEHAGLGQAARRKAVEARLITRRVRRFNTLPPLMRLSGHRPSQLLKWCSVFQALISTPTSEMIVCAVCTSIPSICVRSTPVAR